MFNSYHHTFFQLGEFEVENINFIIALYFFPLEKLRTELELELDYGSVVFVTDPTLTSDVYATFQFDNFPHSITRSLKEKYINTRRMGRLDKFEMG